MEKKNIDDQMVADRSRYNYFYLKHTEMYHKAANHFGISNTSFWIFYLLGNGDRTYTQNELAEYLSLPKQTVNSSIARLVEDGYIRLEQNMGNRKGKTVCLTEQGEEKCLICANPIIEAEKESFEELTREEQQIFMRVFEKRYYMIQEKIQELIKKK